MGRYEKLIKQIYGYEYQVRLEDLKKGKRTKSQKKASLLIEQINCALYLHCCAQHFDLDEHCTDSNFEIPLAIITNPVCDLGTALLMFYKLGGLLFLCTTPLRTAPFQDFRVKNGLSLSFDDKRRDLLAFLYSRIIEGKYSNKEISFIPPLA